jgi:hypothetical protein
LLFMFFLRVLAAKFRNFGYFLLGAVITLLCNK